MSSTPHYYIYPFGLNADDLASIPDNAAVDGSVSYYAGWTDPYEYNLVTNPAALPIPRGQMNQLLFDITLNIQEYQQYGAPQWVVGNTVEYPIYARVYYNNLVYENQVANNTATPGSDATWNIVSGNVGGLPIGSVIDFGGVVVPTDFLLCDGSAYSRSTYAALLASLVQGITCTTSNGLNTISGISSTANMYIGMPVEGIPIPGGTTVASIIDANNITISNTATASGSYLLVFYSWGNGDGSTTFNVPDLRRCTTIGSKGTGTTIIGNQTGQKGGTEAHAVGLNEIPQHTHDASSGDFLINTGTSIQGGTSFGSLATATGGITGYGGGGQTDLSLMQASAVITKCIKYR
jgi:microcystin-dependent protein